MNRQELLENQIGIGQVNIDSVADQDTKEIMLKGLESLKVLGLPHRKLENWKYTNVLGHLEKDFKTNAPEDEVDISIINKFLIAPNYLVFINGKLSEVNSKFPEGIKIKHHVTKDLNENIADIDFLNSLEMMNLINLNNYTSITLSKNAVFEEVLPIVHVYTEKSELHQSSSRIHVHAKEGSKLTLLESFFYTDSKCTNMVNAVTSFQVDNNAQVEHIKVQTDSSTSLHLGTVKANVCRDGFFSSFTYATGGKMARNNVFVNLNGENARGEAHGVFSLKNEQHNDNFIIINHNAPRTYSDQLFKGILTDKSHGIFTGKVKVHRDAQQVESSQLNNNLLLSNVATIDTRPQLEVYADDVKCSHGATTGQISEDEIFYLESRGIESKVAYRMLCHAFGDEALLKIKNLRVRQLVGDLLKGSIITSLYF